MKKVNVTECLDIDLEKEMWVCSRCSTELYSARDSYMKGCLVYERPGSELYGAHIEIGPDQLVSYAPDPNFMRILEFYCPKCGVMLEVQYLPSGHPIPVDIELDIDKLKQRYLSA
jgi:acetone carboxylase gamma subunit